VEILAQNEIFKNQQDGQSQHPPFHKEDDSSVTEITAV
jgi:hypothetical protein